MNKFSTIQGVVTKGKDRWYANTIDLATMLRRHNPLHAGGRTLK